MRDRQRIARLRDQESVHRPIVERLLGEPVLELVRQIVVEHERHAVGSIECDRAFSAVVLIPRRGSKRIDAEPRAIVAIA